jgi:hypothetical protein
MGMPKQPSKWQGLSPQEIQHAGPEARAALRRAMQRTPIASLDLKIYSTQKGDSTATLEIAPSGPFGHVAGTSAELTRILLRELQDSLAALAALG